MNPVHLFLFPHNDDGVLFASFKLQALAPNVLPLVIYESHVQGEGTAAIRRAEDRDAFACFEGVRPHFLNGFKDTAEYKDTDISEAIITALLELHVDKVADVWAPAIYENGHAQHNQIGRVAGLLGTPVRFYHTYSRRAGKIHGEMVNGSYDAEVCAEVDERPVESKPVKLVHVTRKLRALACYRTQIETARFGCTAHFLHDQREWVTP